MAEPASEPGEMAVPGTGALQIEFCGERTLLSGTRPFALGAAADLDLDVGSSLPDRLLEVRRVGDIWWLEQLDGGATIQVSDPDAGWHADLRPGRMVPLVFRHHVVRINARGTYEVELLLSDPLFLRAEGMAVRPAPWPGQDLGPDGSGATAHPPSAPAASDPRAASVELTREQRQLLAVLAEPVLRRGDVALSDIPSSVRAARRLGWPVTKFNRKLDTVCARLAGAGFGGLHGGSTQPALNRRTRLVQIAVTAGLVGAADLAAVDQHQPGL